jgi:hypothetical protein
MRIAITEVSYAASQTLNLKPIHSKAIVSRLNLNLTAMFTMASYAAADCHFRQVAHRRMASVILRIRRAEERERGERAQDHQSVNDEKLFMSLSNLSFAECTEVEYATDRYSESPPPVGTKDRQRRYCAAEEGQRLCTAHTDGARFFKRRSPDFLQIYLSAGNSPPY